MNLNQSFNKEFENKQKEIDKELAETHNDNLKEIDKDIAEKIFKRPDYFDKQTRILDISATNYQAIRSFAFENKYIKKVILPKTLKIIEYGAFKNNSIKELNLSHIKGLVIIDDYAFSNNGLTKNKVKGLDKVAMVSKKAFANFDEK